MMNKANNYLILHKTKRSSYILYIDVLDSMGDRSLKKYGVPVHFKSDYVSKETPYKVVYCRVRNKGIAEFELAMDELSKNLLVCGYNDAQRFLEKITHNMIDVAV